jgi:hypothetical protein
MTQPKSRPGRKPTIDALAVVASLDAGEPPYSLARRLQIAPSSVYRARERARRVVLTELHQQPSPVSLF